MPTYDPALDFFRYFSIVLWQHIKQEKNKKTKKTPVSVSPQVNTDFQPVREQPSATV